ncbi:MAG TPA: hypothetical protein VKV37_23480 [Ktedonobacteraceae bacterium]|nr:hypothetical protein [Ktedonobacteraceae bacterium]
MMSDTLNGFRFIQRAIFSKKAKAPAPSPSAPGSLPGITVRNDAPVQGQNYANTMSVTQNFGQTWINQVWIDIIVLDGTEKVKQLEAGKTYTVKLSSGLNRPAEALPEDGITITSAIELYFYCLPNSKPDLMGNEDISVTLSYEEATHFTKKFSLRIPEQMPSCTLTCRVYYRLPDADYSGEVKRRFTIAGCYTPEDPQLLEACQMETELPEQVAIVSVNSHPDQRYPYGFKLRGWHRFCAPLEEACGSTMITSVAQLMQHQDEPEEIRGKIRRFSEDNCQLLKAWLRKLHARYGEQLCLVIVDSTSQEIPWEMFDLNDEGGQDERFLGALTRVVRWLPPYRSRQCRLHVAEVRYEGEVIAYLDGKLGAAQIAAEQEMLRSLANRRYQTLTDLADQLRLPLTFAGLIYIGCHGESGKRLQQQYPDQLTANYLALVNAHPAPRPIAFFNACESARVLRNDVWDDSSFVEIVLRRFASGYIGTLGKVGMEAASLIARQILTLASSEEIPMAEILRRLRARAAQELSEHYFQPASVRKEYEYNLLYTFMYVYYGNPLACLRLAPGAAHEEKSA